MQGYGRLLALTFIALITLGGCQSDSDKSQVSNNQTTDNPVTNTDDSNNAQGPTVTELQVFASSYQLNVGDSTSFFAVGTFSDNTSEVVTDVAWTVSDPTVATVASDGSLVAVGSGTCAVSAEKDGVTSNVITVWVTALVPQLVIIQAGSTELSVNQSVSVTVLAHYATGSSVIANNATLAAADSSVVLVDNTNGQVTGLALGTTTITAEVEGVQSSPLTITVSDIDVAGGAWVDTDTDFDLTVDDNLFHVYNHNGEAVMGTTSPLPDIHSHYTGADSATWANYEFTGRLSHDDLAGIGVTFYSDFPGAPQYYRLRNTIGNRELRLSPLPFEFLTGNMTTGVVTDPDVWYQFKILVQNQTNHTEIKVNVWEDGTTEPSGWQIDAVHSTAGRLTAGTVGLWSMASGHYFADLAVNGELLPMSQAFALTVSANTSTMQVADTASITVTATHPDGTTLDVSDQATFHLSDPSTVTVVSGAPSVATAVGAGNCTITAEYQGVTSNMLDFLVLPEGGVISGQVSQVSQNGITWTFDHNYEVGQFANGDYWVVGPVNIVNITPATTTVNGWTKHGSMINPTVRQTQGYDSKMYANYGPFYSASLNVALGVSSSNPLTVAPHSSLISSVSIDPALANRRPTLAKAQILTVLPSAPPQGSFRPAYVTNDKTIRFNVAQLDLTQLANSLTPIGGEPTLVEMAAEFKRPWIDHGSESWMVRYMHPRQNMPAYGRDMADIVGQASLMLCMNYPTSEKMDLLINFVQYGIDCWGIVEATGGDTGGWRGNGGHGHARKWPIIFAGLMLGHPGMTNVAFSNTIFGEDDQVFRVVETSPGVLNNGHGNYNYPADINLPEWSMRHKTNPTQDSRNWAPAHGWYYRTCCTANSWGGYVLAQLVMGTKGLWNNDAFFDYQDRYMAIEEQRSGVGAYSRTIDPWTERMWDTHRASYGPVWTAP